MAQLIISFNNQTVKRIKLVKPTYTIGRSNACDIVLPERTISAWHGRLVNSGEDCFLEDIGSTNGILVNDVPTQRHVLHDTDVVKIGKYTLTYRSAVGMVTQLRHLNDKAPSADNSQTGAWLEIASGSKKGETIPVRYGRVVLGGSGVDKVIVERNQAGEYLLHTTNQNQVREVMRLHHQESFKVGEVELTFYTH